MYLKVGDPIPTKGRGSKLTGLQLRFVEEFTDPTSRGYQNATQAVLAAGYKTGNADKLAMQLKQHPLIIKEIKDRMDSQRARMELTADYVLHKLIEMVEQTDKDNDRIRALELLGKNLGLFKERTEISGPDGEAIKYEQKVKQDAADFASRLSRLASRAGEDGLSVVPDTGSASGA